jgi:hypothetical protein
MPVGVSAESRSSQGEAKHQESGLLKQDPVWFSLFFHWFSQVFFAGHPPPVPEMGGPTRPDVHAAHAVFSASLSQCRSRIILKRP